MRRYVLTGNITDKFSISEWIGIEHNAGLSGCPEPPKSPRAKKQTKFERHIEAGQAVLVQFDPRDVMNTPATFPDQGSDFVDPV